jgi:hypothetical protein
MRDALKEVARGTTFKYRPLEDWRVAIFEIYNRKVAENAKLYPIFHTFETAFRSTVAVRIEEYYGVSDWWSPAVSAHRSGSHRITINGVSLPHWVARNFFRIATHLDQLDPRPTIADGYHLLELSKLSHVQNLVTSHWRSIFERIFTKGSKRLTQNDFSKKFKRVRETRNHVYHHMTSASPQNTSLPEVIATAEELLDYLNCSLGFVCGKVEAAKLPPFAFKLPREPRHNCW